MKHIDIELDWKLVEDINVIPKDHGVFMYASCEEEKPPFYIGTCHTNAPAPAGSVIYYAAVKGTPDIPHPELLKCIEARLKGAVEGVSSEAHSNPSWVSSYDPYVKVSITSAYPGWVLNNVKPLNQRMATLNAERRAS